MMAMELINSNINIHVGMSDKGISTPNTKESEHLENEISRACDDECDANNPSIMQSYSSLKQNICKIQWILKRQREIISNYNDVKEKREELKLLFELICIENKVLAADLERERWMHGRELDRVRNQSLLRK